MQAAAQQQAVREGQTVAAGGGRGVVASTVRVVVWIYHSKRMDINLLYLN